MNNWPGWQQWYEIAETPVLRQGDILRDLLVYWFPQTLPVLEADPQGGEIAVNTVWARGTWIVMSASCDVERAAGVYPHALVGHVLPANMETLRLRSEGDLQARLEVLRQGHGSAFLLAHHPMVDPPFPLSFVDWKNHLTMPIDYLRSAVGVRPRLRLRSPLRETFGNWVGSNIQRVGVENDVAIPRFRPIVAEHVLRAEQ